MRGAFFLWLLMGLVALAILYFILIVIQALYVTFQDMWTNRELTKLSDEYSERRQRLNVEAADRLQNGCDHLFDDRAGALPPGVCCRCGIALEKPAGDCDHVWQVQPGIIPSSKCRNCNEEFFGVQV